MKDERNEEFNKNCDKDFMMRYKSRLHFDMNQPITVGSKTSTFSQNLLSLSFYFNHSCSIVGVYIVEAKTWLHKVSFSFPFFCSFFFHSFFSYVLLGSVRFIICSSNYDFISMIFVKKWFYTEIDIFSNKSYSKYNDVRVLYMHLCTPTWCIIIFYFIYTLYKFPIHINFLKWNDNIRVFVRCVDTKWEETTNCAQFRHF